MTSRGLGWLFLIGALISGFALSCSGRRDAAAPELGPSTSVSGRIMARMVELCMQSEDLLELCNDRAREIEDPAVRDSYFAELDRRCSHIVLDGTIEQLRARLRCEGVPVISVDPESLGEHAWR